MRHYILQEHSERCLIDTEYLKARDENPNDAWDWGYGFPHPDAFLMFVKSEFILVEYNTCIEHGDKHGFRAGLVKQMIEDCFTCATFKIKKITIEDELRRLRNKEKYNPFKSAIQVNYIYENAAGKQYAVCSKVPLLDTVVCGEETQRDYMQMEEYLKKEGLTYHTKALDALNFYNNNWVSDYEVAKTTEHLIKQINKISKP